MTLRGPRINKGLGLSQQAKSAPDADGAAGIYRKWVLICCACSFTLYTVPKRRFVAFFPVSEQKNIAAQGGCNTRFQYAGRLLVLNKEAPQNKTRAYRLAAIPYKSCKENLEKVLTRKLGSDIL